MKILLFTLLTVVLMSVPSNSIESKASENTVIPSFTVNDLKEKEIFEGKYLSNTYLIHLEGYENEFGYVIQNTNENLIDSEQSVRTHTIEDIMEVYYNIDPDLIDEIGNDAIFIVEKIK